MLIFRKANHYLVTRVSHLVSPGDGKMRGPGSEVKQTNEPEIPEEIFNGMEIA